ncbi:MAG: hypothetical protein KA734_01795 [Fluviicola sp.]|nr:hypothetical protein [Fluviicola sp.]MBP6272340.1 hypothetical protein [Fluviicola sp.]
MKKQLAKTASLIVFILIVLACKKHKQPDLSAIKNPCDCAKEVSADFDIEENVSPPDNIWVLTDTTFNGINIRFSAKEQDAEYKWYIGAEQFTTQQASRYFGSQWAGSNIPITLVVKKKPNNTCFPNDDGYDSITKVFHISQHPIYYGDNEEIDFGPIEGTYRVKNRNGTGDSIDITINARKYEGQRIVDVYNFDGSSSCSENELRRVDYVGYRILEFSYSGVSSFCNGISGKIENRLNQSALLEFHSRTSVNGGPNAGGYIEVKEWYYEGRKLN